MSEQRDSSGEGRHLQEKTCHAGRGSMLAFCSRMCRLQSQQLELLVCLCTSVLLVIGTRKLQQDGCCDALHAGVFGLSGGENPSLLWMCYCVCIYDVTIMFAVGTGEDGSQKCLFLFICRMAPNSCWAVVAECICHGDREDCD